MSVINKKSDIPLITNPTKAMYERYPMLNTDRKAFDIYSIICKNKGGKSQGILL